MLKKLRKVTSLILTIVLTLLVFTPTAVHAVVPGEDSFPGSQGIAYRAWGNEMSVALRNRLADYDIIVDNNTLVEIVPREHGEGSVLFATRNDGTLITRSALMAVGDDGNMLSFTESDLLGGSATIYPFSDSFKIVFMISYYAYGDYLIPEQIVQPQTAMLIYYDDSNLYTVTNVTMHYDCYGIFGNFDGTNFEALTTHYDYYSYRITVNESNPRSRRYYSNNSPLDSTKAIEMDYTPGGTHLVTFEITGTRKSNGTPVSIHGDQEIFNNLN